MDQQKIGLYIAEKRKSQGLTQVQLAEKLGVGDKSVSKWERGVCLPDVSKYQELCRVLGFSLNELFAGEDLDEINVVMQSEKNIIGFAGIEKEKRKRLFKIIAVLLALLLLLSCAFVSNIDLAKKQKENQLGQLKFQISSADERYTHYDQENNPLVGVAVDETIATITKKSFFSMDSMTKITVAMSFYNSYEEAIEDDASHKYLKCHKFAEENLSGEGINRIICGILEVGGAKAWIYTDCGVYTMSARSLQLDDKLCEEELHFFLSGISVDKELENETFEWE